VRDGGGGNSAAGDANGAGATLDIASGTTVIGQAAGDAR